MKLVNCARYGKEQNLGVVQKNSQIFYEVLEDIPPGTELLVWYGDTYADYMGLPLAIKVNGKQIVTDPQPSSCSKIIDGGNVRSLSKESNLSGRFLLENKVLNYFNSFNVYDSLLSYFNFYYFQRLDSL